MSQTRCVFANGYTCFVELSPILKQTVSFSVTEKTSLFTICLCVLFLLYLLRCLHKYSRNKKKQRHGTICCKPNHKTFLNSKTQNQYTYFFKQFSLQLSTYPIFRQWPIGEHKLYASQGKNRNITSDMLVLCSGCFSLLLNLNLVVTNT